MMDVLHVLRVSEHSSLDHVSSTDTPQGVDMKTCALHLLPPPGLQRRHDYLTLSLNKGRKLAPAKYRAQLGGGRF